MDEGYHSGAVLANLAEREIRSYVPEPERGKRHWSGREQEQKCVYANRRRVRAERSKRLQKLRGELCERSFAHCYETGAMRRCHVRGTDNVLKRVLVQAAGFNIGLQLRKLSGWGQATASPGANKRPNRAPVGRFRDPERVESALEWGQALPLAILPGNHVYVCVASSFG